MDQFPITFSNKTHDATESEVWKSLHFRSSPACVISFFPFFNEYLLCLRHREEAICIKEFNGRKQDKTKFREPHVFLLCNQCLILDFSPFLWVCKWNYQKKKMKSKARERLPWTAISCLCFNIPLLWLEAQCLAPAKWGLYPVYNCSAVISDKRDLDYLVSSWIFGTINSSTTVWIIKT